MLVLLSTANIMCICDINADWQACLKNDGKLLYIRYTNVLLKRVSQGGICFSKNRKAFVSRRALQFKAEEYSDVQGKFRYER